MHLAGNEESTPSPTTLNTLQFRTGHGNFSVRHLFR